MPNNLEDEDELEQLRTTIEGLHTMLYARKQIQRQRMETLLSMVREIVSVLEVYVKD